MSVMKVMNMRTVYHWFLWLPAACITVLSFLLIESHQQTAMDKESLSIAMRMLDAQAKIASQTPQGVADNAKVTARQREDWDADKIRCESFYRSGEGWTVVVFKENSDEDSPEDSAEDSAKVNSRSRQSATVRLDEFGKVISYNGHPMQ